MEFELGGKRPTVHPDAYIAPTAVLIGDVDIGGRRRTLRSFRAKSVFQRLRAGDVQSKGSFRYFESFGA